MFYTADNPQISLTISSVAIAQDSVGGFRAVSARFSGESPCETAIRPMSGVKRS